MGGASYPAHAVCRWRSGTRRVPDTSDSNGFADFLDSADYRADVYQGAPLGSAAIRRRKESWQDETHLLGVRGGRFTGLPGGGLRGKKPALPPRYRPASLCRRRTGRPRLSELRRPGLSVVSRRRGNRSGVSTGSAHRHGGISLLHDPRPTRLLRQESPGHWPVGAAEK